jgi:formylmethanofuran dehydrogenase subunit C
MALAFKSRIAGNVPVDLAGIVPERFRQATAAEMARQVVWRGNRQLALGELFEVAGTNDGQWHFEGPLAAAHRLGAGMQAGTIRVAGHVGRHAGAGMTGGTLSIDGDAGDWCGAEMRGGQITVGGHAGDYLGGCYAGSRLGMRGGTIAVAKSAGRFACEAMRRGWVTVAGDCGDLAGYRMRAGTLLVFGHAGAHPGAEMRRGTLGLFGPRPPALLPTFRLACQIQPVAMSMLLRKLASSGFASARAVLGQPLQMASGDLLEGGRGELFYLTPEAS